MNEPRRAPLIESLEPRQLLSTTLTGVEVFGTVAQTTSIVLTFSGPLDPVTSQNVKGYAFGKVVPGSSDDGFDIGSLLNPFRATGREKADTAKPRAVKGGKIQFSSAVYDSSNDTVTLTPVAPINAKSFMRVLRVRGAGANQVKDASGAPLDGGVDEVIDWRLIQGKTIHYVDSDHDRVTLRLTGPGKLYVFARRGKYPDPTVFIDSTALGSSVTGTVVAPGGLTGVTDIAEINDASGIGDTLVNNASFSIQTVTGV